MPDGTPEFRGCSRRGAVAIPPLLDPPPILKQSLLNSHPRSKTSLQHIHLYNAAFAFSSLKYNPDTRVQGHHPCFSVRGQLSHLHGPLQPNELQAPVFCQLYFCDESARLDFRYTFDSKRRLDVELLTLLIR